MNMSYEQRADDWMALLLEQLRQHRIPAEPVLGLPPDDFDPSELKAVVARAEQAHTDAVSAFDAKLRELGLSDEKLRQAAEQMPTGSPPIAPATIAEDAPLQDVLKSLQAALTGAEGAFDAELREMGLDDETLRRATEQMPVAPPAQATLPDDAPLQDVLNSLQETLNKAESGLDAELRKLGLDPANLPEPPTELPAP